MKKLKVGIIGVGMCFERLHYPAFQKLSDYYEITALCDIDTKQTAKWQEKLNLGQENIYYSWDKLLERDDLDVIDIMVPIKLNYQITEAVAKKESGHKIGIICEKPLAPTLKEAKAAIDLARKYNIPIMIAENYRYNEEINILRDFVRTNKIGDIFYFIQNKANDFPNKMKDNRFQAKEWRQHPEYPGGAITDSALHDIAGLRHIFGPIEKLHAFGRPEEADFAPYSVITANLQFKSGIIGQFSFFSSGREMQRPLMGLRIFGSEGMIFLEERSAGTINIAYNDGNSEQIPYQPEAGYYNELLNFYNALNGSEPINVTPDMEYGDLKTVHDILLSIEEERIISVDDNKKHSPSDKKETYVQSSHLH